MPALEVQEVSVRFGGTWRSTTPRCRPRPAQITGLIGPNGAGKTTMFNVITGLLAPSSGRILIDGEDVTGVSLHKRARMGLARTFQQLELFSMLTVRENIRVAADIRRRWSKDRRRHRRRSPRRSSSGSACADVADDRVTSLPTGQGRLVELGRALACKPRVLLLDEPASGQDDTETERFGQLLVELADQGTAVVLVEHDMSLVMEVCDHVHVLDLGRDDRRRRTARGADTTRPCSTPTSAPASSRRPSSSRGRRADDDRRSSRSSSCAGSAPATTASRCCTASTSPSTPAGWSRCSARTAPASRPRSRSSPGCSARRPATCCVAGRRVNGARPDDLARRGLCLIPEGRGIFPNLTVRENLWMMTHRGGDMKAVEERPWPASRSWAGSCTSTAGTLSGGEQQMLAMARGLATDPALLVLDELSMGLAPIVVDQLYETVSQVASEGTSILLVEQFARIVMDVADDAAVMVQGRIVQTGRPRDLEATLSQAYLGG